MGICMGICMGMCMGICRGRGMCHGVQCVCTCTCPADGLARAVQVECMREDLKKAREQLQTLGAAMRR